MLNIKNTIIDFLYDKNYFITMYENFLYIYNFQEIITLTNELIMLSIENFKIKITGSDLTIKKINSYVQSPNKTELLKDGRIKISHSYIDFKIQRAELKLKDAQRWLILDLKNLKVETSAASDFSLTYTQYFYISDEEFNEIINCLKECNFAFSEQFFGKNNYEKLQNTIRSPYFPKLAMLWDDESEFRKLCFKPDCIELLIKAFTFDVTEFTINLVKNNPLKFCDYAILYLCGFRDNDLIKEIIKLPKQTLPKLVVKVRFKEEAVGFFTSISILLP